MTISELLATLVARNVGAMVVVSSAGLVGIVSERDVVRKLHEHGTGLLELPVSDIMTTRVITCAPADSVDSLSGLMTTNRVRHVPVVEDGALVGIVSIGDVVKTRMEELQVHQEQLEAYITQG
jgi:CBS domain-containing protein